MKFERKSSDTDVSFHEDVPYIAQKRQMSCWYACAKMVLAYSRPEPSAVKDGIAKNTAKTPEIKSLLEKSSPLISTEQTENIGATEKDWPLIAQAFGFGTLTKEEVKAAGSAFTDLSELVKKYGPLWSAGRFYQDGNQQAGHVIVVVGTFVRASKNHVIFHDPAPPDQQGGMNSMKQYDLYFKARDKKFNGLYSLEETDGVPPIMYKKKK